MDKRRIKTGFTLVEILIATSVLAMFLLVGYQVFIRISRSFQKGSWALHTQNKLRNGLHFIREEMQKASYRTDVKIDGTEITEVGFEFHLTSDNEITGNKTIASWYIALPYISHISGSSGAQFKCDLKLEDGNLIYNKTCDDGSDPKERQFSNYLILKDVEKIEVAMEDFDMDKTVAGNLVSLKITVGHADKVNYPHAKVIDQTGAKVEVVVQRDL